jgi:hypothetical protein
MTTLETIDLLIHKRNKYIYQCAKNILKKVRRTDLYQELVSECYLYVYSIKDKLVNATDNEIESVIINWMNYQIIWQGTHFKKKYIYGNNQDENINIETIDEPLDEEDILEKEMDFQNKLDAILIKVNQLPLDKKILFDVVFNQNINTSGKLAKHIGTSRTTAYWLIKDLKEHLKN